MASQDAAAPRLFTFAMNIKFEAFEVEHVPDHIEVRLPSLFSNQHCQRVPSTVFLFDVIGNFFEVAVVKKGTDVYFVQGWPNVGKFYGLHLGGWVRMVYVRLDRFFIEVQDRLKAIPFVAGLPRIVRLDGQPTFIHDGDDIVNVFDQSMYVGRNPMVVFTLYLTLGVADLATCFLHLPYTFCDTVFSRIDADVILVDEMGRPFPCHLIFPRGSILSEVRLRGWFACCRENGFTEGVDVKLEVLIERPRFIFLSRR